MTSARTRLAGFAVVLAALVGGGYAIGSRFPTDGSSDHEHEPADTSADDTIADDTIADDMDDMDHGEAP